MATKSFVRLPLTDGHHVLMKHSAIRMVYQNAPGIDPKKECFIVTTDSKRSLFRVALNLDAVEELLG